MRKLAAVMIGVALGLAGCGSEEVGASSAQAQMTEGKLEFRRVWSGPSPNFYASAPSPDGRYVSEIDWTGGDLAVRDLLTGELKLVTHKLSWADSVDYAEYSVFSPDGERLAYTWFSDSGRGYELREIGVDGTGMRTLVESHPDLAYVEADDYAPDGSQILTTILRADRSSAIATVSTADGTMRVLKTSDWRHPFVAMYSPDSRYIAYDFPPDPDDTQRDIFAMPIDGSRETKLVGGPSHDVLMGWLPDGGAILFYSDRHHTRGIWQQAVRDGRPVGDPVLLAGDVWQLSPLGFADGAYYYGVWVESPQVHTATIDLANDRVVVPPTAVVGPSEGSTSFGAWSPDNLYFAYLHARPGDRRELVIRSVAGQETRELPLDLTQARYLQWHPDGGSVVLSGTDPKGRRGLHRIDIRTGERTPFLIRDEQTDPAYRIAADGRTVFLKRWQEGQEQLGLRAVANVVAVNVHTREERVLHEVKSGGRVFLSPDGEFYATRDYDVDTNIRFIKVGRTDGTGELRTILESDTRIPHNRGGFPWTPDGKFVLVPQQLDCQDYDSLQCEVEGTSRILKVPVDGGEPTVLMTVAGAINDLELSPDGRRLSFLSGNSRGEIWRIDNLPSGPSGVSASTGSH